LTAFNGAYRRVPDQRTVGMIAQMTWMAFAGGLFAQQTDWIAAGNRALDKGSPEEAAADFAHELDEGIRAGSPVTDLLHLRVTLATAYMEAGEYREMEAVLQEAQKTWQLTDGVSRAELLNAWSALHLKLGQLSAAEAELREAWRTVQPAGASGDLLPTILHNLAAVEMRRGRYAEALGYEQDAMQRLERMLAPDHPTLIRGWASLASLQFMMGKPAEAKESFARALASAERTYGPSHAFVAELLESDAIVLDKLKVKKEAKQVRARARKIRGTSLPSGQNQLIWSVREPLTPDGQVSLRSK